MGRNPLLLSFCNDLADRLRGRCDADYFFDEQNIPAGSTWLATLENGLQLSKSFLAFYSPAYFSSPDCGREIKAFQIRAQAFQQANPHADLAYCGPLGILWESETQLSGMIPASLAQVQYNVPPHARAERTVALRKIVKEMGLYQICRRADLGSNEDALTRDEIIDCYADHIYRMTTQYNLSPFTFTGPYSNLAYDFPREARIDAGITPPQDPGPKGPKFVKVLLLVGTSDAFDSVPERQSRTCYDPQDDRLWKPYFPDDDEIFLLVSRAVTEARGITEPIRWNVAPERQALLRVIDEVERNNNLLLVIVDPWSCFLVHLQESFDAIDQRRLENGALFFPWNSDDSDTKAHLPLLQATVGTAFRRLQQEGRLSELIYDSPKALENKLKAKIVELRSQIVNRAARAGQIRSLPQGSALPTVAVPSR